MTAPVIAAAPASAPSPVSAPPTARALFGAPTPEPAAAPAPAAPATATTTGTAGAGPALGPMRPRAATLAGIGNEYAPYHAPSSVTPHTPVTPEVAKPDFVVPQLEDPAWAPPRAEPGDMGWDIVYGVKRSLATNVQPKYHFEHDDEPTSEIQLPEEQPG
jgi:hypothetical protein